MQASRSSRKSRTAASAPEGGRGGAPGRPRKLSHENVVDVAAQMIRESGVDAVSMRTLSARLGVKAPALYTYFAHLDEIETAALERIVADLPMPELDNGKAIVGQIVELFAGIREIQARNPRVLIAKPGSMAWMWSLQRANRLLKLFCALDAKPDEALLAYYTLCGLTTNAALFGAQPDAKELAQRQRMLEQMPAADVDFIRQLQREQPALTLPSGQVFREILRKSIHALLPGAVAHDESRKPRRRK